jgi:agarase
MKKLFITSLMCATAVSSLANDWDDIPLPVSPGQGLQWELQESYSDSFNYTGKTNQFSQKWNDTYFKNWTGPGLTHWDSNESWVADGNLIISASRRNGTNKVNAGVVTSKTKVKYPIFMEASIKVSNLELSSNFWLLSENDQREIDILEVYGGARDDWFARNMSTNFHVFVRNQQTNDIISDFNDQTHFTPTFGTYWREGFHRFGAYWKSPTDVTFYINGQKTTKGAWSQVVMRDKDYTGALMDKNVYQMDQEMFIILDTEDHSWRSEQGIVATDADLANENKNKMFVDWIRVYKPVSNGDNSDQPSTGGIEKNNASLQAKHSSKCIDVKQGATWNGSVYHQWACGANNINQKFDIVAVGNNEYAITSKRSGLCMELENGSLQNGAKIQQWVCDYSDRNQRWKFQAKGDGYYEIRSAVSNKCVDIAGKQTNNGAAVVQWNCFNGNNQRFRIN